MRTAVVIVGLGLYILQFIRSIVVRVVCTKLVLYAYIFEKVSTSMLVHVLFYGLPQLLVHMFVGSQNTHKHVASSFQLAVYGSLY